MMAFMDKGRRKVTVEHRVELSLLSRAYLNYLIVMSAHATVEAPNAEVVNGQFIHPAREISLLRKIAAQIVYSN